MSDSRSSGDEAEGAVARGIFFVYPGDGPRFIAWRHGRTVLGRNPGCTIPLAGRAVSWEHAELRFDGQTAVLRDLKSTNGLLVDGAPVSEALIEDGRVIRLGDFVGVAGSEAVDAAGWSLPEAEQLEMHVGPVLRAALQPLLIHATSPRPVVIEGETGTGKRLTARLCHQLGQRAGGFVVVDCVADDRRPLAEMLAAAAGGTLYLANLGALPAVEQDRLAAALAEGADVALVAGSQEPLATAVAEGRLQQSLYQQLDGVKLRLPPLRQRLAELPSLFRRLFERYPRGGEGGFAAVASSREGTGTLSGFPSQLSRDGRRGRCPLLSSDLVERLCLYDWPCNVRELVLLVERLSAMHGDELRLRSAHLPARMMPPDLEKITSPVTPVNGVDASSLLDALREAGGNVARAAARLGITRERAYRLIERLGLSATSRAGA